MILLQMLSIGATLHFCIGIKTIETLFPPFWERDWEVITFPLFSATGEEEKQQHTDLSSEWLRGVWGGMSGQVLSSEESRPTSQRS